MKNSTFVIAFFLSAFIDQARGAGCVPTDPQVPRFDASQFATNEARESWAPQNFSDPANFDPQHYRFIVHTIDNFGIKYTAHSSYDFIANTMTKLACSTFSASVIDEKKTASFGVVGFIMSAPAENMIVAGPKDIGSPNLNANKDPNKYNAELNNYFRQVNGLSLLTPSQMLEQTDSSRWNEVLIQSRVNESMKITGIYIVAHPRTVYGGFAEHVALVNELLEIAKEKNLPVVYLEERRD